MQELEKYRGRLTIVQGDKDRLINWRANKIFFDTLDNKEARFVLIKGAKHGFHREPYETEAVNSLLDFFSE